MSILNIEGVKVNDGKSVDDEENIKKIVKDTIGED